MTDERSRLDVIEARVLGSLLEKEQATPEYYPMTLNAVTLAANQKSNREPVLELAEGDVARALDRLQQQKLVWRIVGGRATRWQHNVDAVWRLDRASKAVITLLLLRGPQTPGELRSRSDRLHRFESLAEVETVLQGLGSRPEPLVAELPRRPGQKEARWTELLSERAPAEETATQPADETFSARLDSLEKSIAGLAEEIQRLKTLLGE